MIMIKNCPFCEHSFSQDDIPDTIYPIDREKTTWQCGCNICGATIYGSSPEEAVSFWNKRARIDWLD